MAKERDPAVLADLEKRCREIGTLIGDRLPEGVGFALMLFTYGGNGWSTYISSAKRQDMIALLTEMLHKLKFSPEPPSVTSGKGE